MANFHITAVFETRGDSQAEAERVAATTLPQLRHPRMHYVEHDTSGGLGPYPPGRSLYFSTIAEFDVEAYTEEKAVELAEDILDRFSTDTIHYLGHGIIPGTPRVQPEERKGRDDGRRVDAESPSEPLDEGQGEREEQGGKGRRPQRGRGRKRGGGRERGRAHEESALESLVETLAPDATEEHPTSESEAAPAAAPPLPEVPTRVREVPALVVLAPVVEEPPLPPPPPPRSSAEMRVTLTVSVRASEVARMDAFAMPMDDELLPLAVAEARRRHPELPADAAPESAISPLPAGDRLIALTWHYQSPVPSAAEVS